MKTALEPRIAVIGCGAIAQVYHLPALLALSGMQSRLILVDRNKEQLEKVASEFGIANIATDYGEVLGQCDGVVIATPPATHYPIALECLSRGLHVLCEKPLTEDLEEARKLVSTADAAGVVLAVNLPCRLFPTYRKIRQLIAEGVLGELQSITYHEGSEFHWPAVSPFYFAPGSKGVLSDTGIHLLDTICWWLDAQPDVVISQNDSFGGPEAVALVQMRHRECEIEVKVSRLTRLRDRYCICGSRARIEAPHQQWDWLDVEFHNGKRRRIRLKNPHRTFNEFGRPMLRNFVEAIAGREPVIVSGSSALPGIAVLEEAYREAVPFELPWNENLEVLHV